jgi:nicotinamidase-related amidase
MTDARAPVIVIDLQTLMFKADPPLWDASGLEARVRAVLAWARREGRKVAFVRHDGRPGEAIAEGAWGWPVWPALGQAEDEPTFRKSVGDSFSNPDLVAWVRGQGADGVILLGAQSDQCVAASTSGALERGLAVTVVEDAHSTWDWNGETAAQIIARLNARFAEAGATVVPVNALTAP